jgi:branched-chain amino acid transport system substrate-binding protein
MIIRTLSALTLSFAVMSPALAQQAGVTDTEIKIGQTMAYSGPASAFSIIGKTYVGYFQMVNDNGGINGRKINLLSVDDAYSPPKTIEATRRLVEQDEVLAIFGSMGTAPNAAIQPYLNQKKVPQVIGSGASRFSDPAHFPWSLSFYPSYELEGETLARHALAEKPDGKIAILYQNDDSGRDFVRGFKKGLGDKTANIVAEAGYDVSEPTIRAQISELHASGADTLFVAPIPKFAAQAIREVANLQWKPLFLLTSPGSTIESALMPAGPENALGVISTSVFKTVSPQWEKDEDVIKFKEFVAKYVPEGKATDFNVAYGYVMASFMAQVLEDAGRDLSREKVLEVVTSLNEATAPMLLPGVTVSSSKDDYNVFDKICLQRFDGKEWQSFDEGCKVR